MGMIAPQKGQVHRMTLELKGGKIDQRRYQAYKNAISKIVKRYKASGAAIKGGRGKLVKVRKGGR